MRETVGDLDILVTAAPHSPVMQRFTAYDEVAEVFSAGETRASVLLKCGMQVDLRVVAQESYRAALHYFTGSKSHNIAIRRIAQQLGLKVNEYGVFRGAQRIAGDSEESVYRAVGLPYIAPELREDRGEIEAARANRLPRLVELSDLKGDLHAHTRATDGHDTLLDMALAAKALGMEYLRHHRTLAPPHRRARPRPGQAGKTVRRDRQPQRRAERFHAAQGHRGGHPRGRQPRFAGFSIGTARPGGRRGAQ